jgi:hypothetical protein
MAPSEMWTTKIKKGLAAQLGSRVSKVRSAGVFGCQIQDMPFTYLGLPMGTTKPRVEHYALLMNRVERQPTSISSMLTQASKLQLVNSVLSSLPTFTLCYVQVPVAVLEYFGRARRYGM